MNRQKSQWLRTLVFVVVIAAVGGLAFAAGLSWSSGKAEAAPSGTKSTGPRVTRTEYPKKTELDFEGMPLQGELRSPGEFYFQHKPEEKFDSLVKRRKNFHKEMLRDAVLSK
jgi:hypothetical protein